jgi:hypothetical protein
MFEFEILKWKYWVRLAEHDNNPVLSDHKLIIIKYHNAILLTTTSIFTFIELSSDFFAE